MLDGFESLPDGPIRAEEVGDIRFAGLQPGSSASQPSIAETFENNPESETLGFTGRKMHIAFQIPKPGSPRRPEKEAPEDPPLTLDADFLGIVDGEEHWEVPAADVIDDNVSLVDPWQALTRWVKSNPGPGNLREQDTRFKH